MSSLRENKYESTTEINCHDCQMLAYPTFDDENMYMRIGKDKVKHVVQRIKD